MNSELLLTDLRALHSQKFAVVFRSRAPHCRLKSEVSKHINSTTMKSSVKLWRFETPPLLIQTNPDQLDQ